MRKSLQLLIYVFIKLIWFYLLLKWLANIFLNYTQKTRSSSILATCSIAVRGITPCFCICVSLVFPLKSLFCFMYNCTLWFALCNSNVFYNSSYLLYTFRNVYWLLQVFESYLYIGILLYYSVNTNCYIIYVCW